MSLHRPDLLTKIRCKAVMNAANGAPCTLRIASIVPGKRCASPDTTVGAHLPIGWGKGISTKVTDAGVCFACVTCHAILDGVDRKSGEWLNEKYPALMQQRMLSALTETHALLIDAGILRFKNMKLVGDHETTNHGDCND